MFNISIGKRTFIVVFCTTLILFSMLYLISDLMYIGGYRNLENQSVDQNAGRISDALTSKMDTLASTTYDWATSDDTYQFSQTLNSDYFQRNLQNPDGFADVSVNAFVIINPQGQVIFDQAYDQKTGKSLDLPGTFLSSLTDARITSYTSPGTPKTGIIMEAGKPMMIAASPILSSDGKGPSSGTLVLGRFVDADVIASVAKTTNLSLSILPLDYPQLPGEVKQTVQTGAVTSATFIQVINTNSIQGYRVVDDIFRQPAFVFRVDMPRQIFNEGQKTLVYLHLSLFLMSIGFFFVFIFVVNKTILNRMTALSNGVNKIGSEGNPAKRVTVPGRDELSGLADNINGMLESIEKAGAEIQNQKEFIDSILTHTPNAVLVVDKAQSIKMTNSAFNTLFGLTPANLKDQTLNGISALNDLSYEAKKFMDSSDQESKTELQYRGNGLRKTLTVSFTRMKEDTLFLIIFTDITTEMDRQDRLYLTDRLASVGEMASGIAHELNNPLSSIVGLSELLTEEELSDTIREDVTTINSEARRAASVVKNMLSFARKHTASKQAVQMNQVIDDVLKLRAYHWRVNNINVETDLDRNLPNVLADYFQMQQVFLNIILNAEQSMVESHGKGTLKITSELVDKMVRLTFTDDGMGIAPQNVSRIFDPFFTTKEVGNGTGLGLSICFGIVTSHGGRVYANSEAGRGATFIVELPAQF